MSDEIVAIVPRNIEETKALAKELSISNLLPSALRQKPADIVAIVLTGAELGIKPMTALRGMDLIGGQVALRSSLLGAVVQSRMDICEYLTPIESTDKIATFETKRKGSPKPVIMSYTIEQAKIAGLAGKDNWRKDPQAMLLARCRSRICRAVYADLTSGVYDKDSGELDEVEVNHAPAASEPRPQAEALKAAIRAEVTDVVEGELVSSEPVQSAEPQTLLERVKNAPTGVELRKTVEEIKTAPVGEIDALKDAYRTRQQELANAPKS